MIFILIVFAVLALLFTFLYMQQKASLESFASFAAQQGAELWLDSRRSMENGAINDKKPEDQIGYRVFDNLLFSNITYEGHFEEMTAAGGQTGMVFRMDTGDGLPGQKAALIGEALSKRLESSILKPESTKVRITFNNNALRARLIVEVTQELKVPLVGIREFFCGKDTLTLNARYEAAVTEPDEYIRNFDLAVEVSRRFGDVLDLKDLTEKIKAKEKGE